MVVTCVPSSVLVLRAAFAQRLGENIALSPMYCLSSLAAESGRQRSLGTSERMLLVSPFSLLGLAGDNHSRAHHHFLTGNGRGCLQFPID